jgi:RHS repeat-associated protein
MTIPGLNYIVFDLNYQMQDAGAMRIPDAAGFNPGNELLVAPQRVSFALPIAPRQTGYIYAWVSNETQGSKVWFDDLKVTHTYSRVTQATDFYAFGSVLREQKSPDDLIYRYGYQGQYSERDEETNWNHFELREYDPIIGRWLVPDPYKQYWSPYVAFGNNPVNNVDPRGGTDNPFGASMNVIPDYQAGPRSVVSWNGIFTSLGDGGWAQISFLDEVEVSGKRANVYALPMPGSLSIPEFSVLSTVLTWGSAILATSAILKGDESEKTITLYRGVYNGHPDYANAVKGTATPYGGHDDPEMHNLGDYKCIFTSWSMSKAVANYHANKHGPGGLVLEKKFRWSETVPSPDNFAELEMLVPGVVTGAKVGPPNGPGSPTGY